MLACRLILDPPGPGAWNMAVDEALLESGGQDDEWTLRFYGWSEPTLSLGYFQSVASRQIHTASRSCPLVRRQSGGGAIVHDAELTYSLTVPARHALARDSQRLYRAVHAAFVGALASAGISAELYETLSAPRPASASSEPFLCFNRRGIGDILIGTSKVGGSAQRRRGGSVLQHGSLLLRRSAAAPELPGIEDLCRQVRSWEEWRSLFSGKLVQSLEIAARAAPLSESLRQRAADLAQDKYAAPSWNARR
ncbi:MAG TPA: lipoate--protein ligase family protein [Pirellulales bacterium]|nr:lipoate--protein ligase family protein [Pirellulales bacterium]